MEAIHWPAVDEETSSFLAAVHSYYDHPHTAPPTAAIVDTRTIVEAATNTHLRTTIDASSSGINVSRTKDGGDRSTDTAGYGRC